MTPSAFTSIRQSHGSQRNVAARLGISYRTLQRVESGEYGEPIPAKYEHMIRGLSVEKGTIVARGKGSLGAK